MDYAKTVPSLHQNRLTIRTQLRQSEQKRFEEIQNHASEPADVQRRRTTRQLVELTAHNKNFESGINTYQHSLDKRMDFIKSLEDKDRKRLVDAEIKHGREAYDAADNYVFEFRKAKHLTEPREKREHKDLSLEKTLYLKAKDIIANSEEMFDFVSMHVGKPTLPPKSAWQLESEKQSNEYISATQKKEDAHQQVNSARNAITQLVEEADEAENKVRALNVSLEKTGGSISF